MSASGKAARSVPNAFSDSHSDAAVGRIEDSEEKESHRWLESWRKADALYHRLGGHRRVVSVADREGDIYEAFALCLQSKAARGQPEQPATSWLGRDQWQALYCYTHKTKDLPPEPPSLKKAVDWIARLGGYLNRKCDGPPGAQVLWRGKRRLEDITETHRLFRNEGTCG